MSLPLTLLWAHCLLSTHFFWLPFFFTPSNEPQSVGGKRRLPSSGGRVGRQEQGASCQFGLASVCGISRFSATQLIIVLGKTAARRPVLTGQKLQRDPLVRRGLFPHSAFTISRLFVEIKRFYFPLFLIDCSHFDRVIFWLCSWEQLLPSSCSLWGSLAFLLVVKQIKPMFSEMNAFSSPGRTCRWQIAALSSRRWSVDGVEYFVARAITTWYFILINNRSYSGHGPVIYFLMLTW